MLSKPKFRSRKLDFKRALPICYAEDLPDLDDEANRAMPTVATGVEKEEEEEHHLQAVISAAQVREKAANVYIPIPDATQLIDYYTQLYNRPFRQPKSLIRFSSIVEDCIGTSYCMDEADDAWLREINSSMDEDGTAQTITPDQFEILFTELERISETKQKDSPMDIASLDELESFAAMSTDLSFNHQTLSSLYEFWHDRRIKRNNAPLMPQLRFEDTSMKAAEHDPFICFRKREIRTTRKTRRTDMQSVQKLRQLRSELESARQLLEMVSRREKMRRETINLDQMIFEQRVLVREIKSRLQLPDEVIEEARAAQKKRSVKSRAPAGGESLNARLAAVAAAKKRKGLEETEVLDPLMIEIENDVRKRLELDSAHVDATETFLCPDLHPAIDFWRTDIPLDTQSPYNTLPLGRCRIGRGGRLLIDRPRRKAPPTPPLPSSGHSENGGERWRFDNFGELSEEEDCASWQSPIHILNWRLKYAWSLPNMITSVNGANSAIAATIAQVTEGSGAPVVTDKAKPPADDPMVIST